METNKTIMLRVGIFVTLGLILLVWFSLKSEEPAKVKGGYPLFIRFEEIKGIEEGTVVTMSGVDVGRVDKIKFESESGKVRVDLTIQRSIKIRKDSIGGIYLKSLLGQNIINITPGKQKDVFLKPGDEVVSKETVDLDHIIETIGGLGDKAENLIENLNENQSDLLKKVSSVIDENKDNLKTTTESFAKVAPKFESMVNSFDDMLTNLKKGEGSLGKMLTDDSMYNKFSDVGDNLDEIAKKINSGEGTLGKLLSDDSLHKKAEDSLTNVKDAAEEIRTFLTENKQSLKEFVDAIKEVPPKIKEASDNLADITKKINEGQGTLGKLVNDPKLYDDTRDAINQMKQTFQESEEQAVMRTFLGIVFGSMM